jgi:hypothetical protein
MSNIIKLPERKDKYRVFVESFINENLYEDYRSGFDSNYSKKLSDLLRVIDGPIEVKIPKELSPELIETITESFKSSLDDFRRSLVCEFLPKMIKLQIEVFIHENGLFDKRN